MSLHIANDYFKQHRYERAIQFYNKALNRKPTLEATAKLADCYRLTKDYARAEFWYEKALVYNEVSADILLKYGQMLKSNEKFEKAKTIFERYANLPGVDINYGKNLASSCDSAVKWTEQKGGITLRNRDDLNSAYSDFGGVGLSNYAYVISTNRPTVQNRVGKLTRDTEQPYFKIAVAQLDSTGTANNIYRFQFDKRSDYHQATPCFSKNLDTMYFTETRMARVNREKINRLGIYYTVRVGDKWTEPKEFSYNNNAFSVAHPFLANNGTELYFVSDVPGGQGGFDIYMCHLENGGWSSPVNLGAEVNSSEDEFYPVLKDNHLYFSSMGHIGMGGLDIYMANFEPGTGWTNVQNMKAPFNSPQDDFGLYFNDDYHTGFISSNRRGGLGYDDIYAFDYNERLENLLFVELRPYQKANGQTIWASEAVSTMKEKISGKEIDPVRLNGKVVFPIEPEKTYAIRTVNQGLATLTNSMALEGLTFADSSAISELPLQMGVFYTFDIEIPYSNNGSYNLNNIYYDFNKASLRPEAKEELNKLIRILEENPHIRIQIGSYCDSRGSDSYNLNLSNRRAQSVVNYLIERGVSKKRLSYKGFGENGILNGCNNGVDCTEEQHQQNRRTDFQVK